MADTSHVMNREQALKLVGELTEAGYSALLRPRSWSSNKAYWAVEVQDPKTTLYTPEQADTLLKPIDVLGVYAVGLNGFHFYKPDALGVLSNPYRANRHFWTLDDIRNSYGVVTERGKRYRLLPPDNLFNHKR